ncbi:hypothetical protein [Nocardia sp. CA-119907]|uniref:hypothetical protein n=1 Tax=Nocardia sp. CA-119907 TaxID=3239973 RepID=UPI003D980FD3
MGTRKAAIGPSMDSAAHVVRSALRALERNRGYVVPGAGNFASAHLMPRRPRTLVARIAKLVTRGVADAADQGSARTAA